MSSTCVQRSLRSGLCSGRAAEGCTVPVLRGTCAVARPRSHPPAFSCGNQRLQSSSSRSPTPPRVTCRAAAETSDTKADTEEPRCEEVMNPHPVLLKASMPIKEAVHLLLDNDVSGAPVVDDGGHLVGILSESDIIWKGAGAPADHFIIPPIFIGFADAFIYLRDNKQFDEEVHKILAKTVADAMTKEVLSVKPETPMSAAAQLMLHKQVNLLPVEAEGKVVGIITRHDVLRGIYASKSPFL